MGTRNGRNRERRTDLNLVDFEQAFDVAEEKQRTRLHSYNNLQQVSWLREGMRRAKSVCRIVTPYGLGTGLLIAPDLVLTNAHVIDEHPEPDTSWVEFNYEIDWEGNPTQVDRFRMVEVLKTDPYLDYSIVVVDERPGEEYGFINIRDTREPRPESVSCRFPVLVQHPRGGFKHLALTGNVLLATHEQRMYYTTPAEPGSSGAPVFDNLWRPIAIHKAGEPHVLPDKRRVVLNEAVILTHIVEHAREVIGATEHTVNVMADLLDSGCFDHPESCVNLDWYISNPRLHRAFKMDARGTKSETPLLAAAAGVAAGAAARHWNLDHHKETQLRPLELQIHDGANITIDNPMDFSREVFFEEAFDMLRSPDVVPHLKDIGRELPFYDMAPLAAAFLGGLKIGTASYPQDVR